MKYDKYKGHTPGPWEVREFETCNLISNPKIKDNYSSTIARTSHWSPPRLNQPDKATAQANATLIADAPLLLARCKEQEAENKKLRDTLRGVEVELRSERHNHVTDTAYDDTGSTIANCINIICQALAKGGE